MAIDLHLIQYTTINMWIRYVKIKVKSIKPLE